MASFGDFNRVNTNVTALSAQLSLNKINRELGDSRLKLSTGKRINSAEDNSAGYAIATKLNSRVKGLEQALQNVSDAKSMLDVVEGAYNSVVDILIKMKSLSIQAANENVAAIDRSYIADQLEALSDNINEIAAVTNFNGIALLDGVAQRYLELSYKQESIEVAKVISSISLSAQQQQNLAEKLKTITGAKQIKLALKVDPNLIGGFTVEIGSQYIDTSIRGQLRKISNLLGATN